MTGARKSMLTGVILFLLITFLVAGGMTWATISSFELAKKTVADEEWARVHRALYTMESHLKAVIFSEASRPHSDYVDYHWDVPVAILGREGMEPANHADIAVLRSPIAMKEELPQEWIELYFQFDPETQEVTSPQWDREQSPWASSSIVNRSINERRSWLAWEWLQRALPTLHLDARVAAALKELESVREKPQEERTSAAVKPAQQASAALGDDAPADWRDFTKRKQRVGRSQSRYVPKEQCIDPRIAARLVLSGRGSAVDALDTIAGPADAVGVKLSPFVGPFWIEKGFDGRPKLAFVRECQYDANVRYQGFIADWERLKTDLLRFIADDFPKADLKPVPDGMPDDPVRAELLLTQIPAALDIPDIAGAVPARAWQSIRATVGLTWTVALIVLVVAGWGVRNLVMLTERRMQFAYAVTHELRTPLTTFRLYSDMLSAGLVSDEAKPEYLDTLNRESQRLASLVESVLEYARVENHKVKLHTVETGGDLLFRVLSETLQKHCDDAGVKGRLQNDIPEHLRFRTDVNLLNQIVSVLVHNGCRHARQSPDPRILVCLSADGHRMQVEVIDSGPGVNRADARDIFKPFRRGRDADTTARGGIGLGLALARNWAHLFKGRLDLASRHHPQYGGAHFRLTVPVEAIPAPQSVAAAVTAN